MRMSCPKIRKVATWVATCYAATTCFFSINASAAEINIVQLDQFRGTIGNHPVHVLLGNSRQHITGYYYYGNHASKKEALTLDGKYFGGQWELQEAAKPLNSNGGTKETLTGEWKIRRQDGKWAGTWSKQDGSGALPVTLEYEKEAVDYAVIGENNSESSKKGESACTINVFRRQNKAEVIDASVEDAEGCERTYPSFPDLNFDGYADLIFPIDSPLHNITYRLMLYRPTTHNFQEAGSLTEPGVDPIHKNIVVSIHNGAASHGTEIYRFLPGKEEPTLIQSSAENSGYDAKTGKIVVKKDDDEADDN